MSKTIDHDLFPFEIGRVEKSKKEVYIVSVNEFKGKRYIDIRLHFYVGTETRPTKKGVTLNLRTFEPMAKLLIDAYKALQELEENSEENSPEE